MLRTTKMTRDEFREKYPDIKIGNNYSKIINVEVTDDWVKYTEEIDLTHPDCPIVVIKPITNETS